MTNETKTPHIHNLRKAVMTTLAMYVHMHDDVDDAAMLGALSACMCDALIIKGHPFNDATIDVIRRTYEVCEMQHAMAEKENNSVQ